MNNKFSIKDIITTCQEKRTFIILLLSLYIFLIFPFIRLGLEILYKYHRLLIGSFLVLSLLLTLIMFILYLYMFHEIIYGKNMQYRCNDEYYKIINRCSEIRFIFKMAEIILTSYAYLLLWTMSYIEIISLALKNRILTDDIGDHVLVIIILVIIVITIMLKTLNNIFGYEISRK